MPRYSVLLFENGIWNSERSLAVEAKNPKDAAEKAAGEPLSERGARGNLRAEVVSANGIKVSFYRRMDI